jgi:hypothetical protein
MCVEPLPVPEQGAKRQGNLSMLAMQSERLDQHAHVTRRPAAGDGERNAGVKQLSGRCLCRRGQHLVLANQCAVHVGQQ